MSKKSGKGSLPRSTDGEDLEWKLNRFDKNLDIPAISAIWHHLNGTKNIGGSKKVYRIPLDRSGSGKVDKAPADKSAGGSRKVDKASADKSAGGSGKVSPEFVVVKKISNKLSVSTGELEKIAEIEIPGKIRHQNIVNLMGYYSSSRSTLSLYEYYNNGTLDGLLHGNQVELRNWPKRLHIARGVAQGLRYMHNHHSTPAYHKKVRSSNILVDDDWGAKIASFGSAKVLENREEYAQTKTDVYDFGVILLELITGRKVPKYEKERSSLADWAQRLGKETIDASDIDNNVYETKYLEEINQVFKLALSCTAKSPTDRFDMTSVWQILSQYGTAVGVGTKENGSI